MKALLLLLVIGFVPNRAQLNEDQASRKTFSRPDKGKLTNSSLIVGGTAAGSSEFPWHVQGNGCGGSLIGANLVLTAAHCTTAFDDVIYIGNTESYDLNVAGSENHLASTRITHPSYSSITDEFDIMLVKLDIPSNRPLITLNTDANNPADGADLTVIGFGDTAHDGDSSDILLKVTLDAVSNSECNEDYGGGITSNMICAERVGKDSCQGDSGGPLFDANKRQVGVVSFGVGCADPDYPGGYARVSSVYSWIVSQGCAMGGIAPFCPPPVQPPTGSNTVTIEVKHDTYPQETAWKFTDKSGQIFSSQVAGAVLTESSTVTKSIQVPAGDYIFTIRDFYGDGMCCDYGRGHFKVKVNGLTVVEGASFGSQESHSIKVVDPSASPTNAPTFPPTNSPTLSPTRSPTSGPTNTPTNRPTNTPTNRPTNTPTARPTQSPTLAPVVPTNSPTDPPTGTPTPAPSNNPTLSPTPVPTRSPTTRPTSSPTSRPTSSPTLPPTQAPTRSPTNRPTERPTLPPTRAPTRSPTSKPTERPTLPPTRAPTRSPTSKPTERPTPPPTRQPTGRPTLPPTPLPTPSPTSKPSPSPTTPPTRQPTTQPTTRPTRSPTNAPTTQPTPVPTRAPTNRPTTRPTTPSPTLSTAALLNDWSKMREEANAATKNSVYKFVYSSLIFGDTRRGGDRKLRGQEAENHEKRNA